MKNSMICFSLLLTLFSVTSFAQTEIKTSKTDTIKKVNSSTKSGINSDLNSSENSSEKKYSSTDNSTVVGNNQKSVNNRSKSTNSVKKRSKKQTNP